MGGGNEASPQATGKGEAAMRMQTTSEQLILVLKIGEGENKQYRDDVWGSQVISRENAWMRDHWVRCLKENFVCIRKKSETKER